MRLLIKTVSTLTICLLISFAGTRDASAITVSVNAGLGLGGLVDSSGAFLADGSQVQLGFFDSGFDVATNASDLTALGAAWNLFGTTSVTTILGQAGRLGDSLTLIDTSFDNQQIFWWATDVSSGDYGIFSSSLTNWLFPEEGAAIQSTLTSSSEVNQFFHSNLDGLGNLQLQAGSARVPDSVTTLWLSLTALAGLSGFRRLLTNRA